MKKKKHKRTFPSAVDDAGRAAELVAETPQTLSPAYRLAFMDGEFLLQDELRPVRLQLELLKPELIQNELGIENTVVIFGGARIPPPRDAEKLAAEAEATAAATPEDEALASAARIARRMAANSAYYEQARRLSYLISRAGEKPGGLKLTVVTGGGPGIMEAGNRGASEAGARSIGLNIVLPMEQRPNDFITPELCFQFHYFAIRKMHFLLRARALVVFPGGYGTLDELFETLTLIQTGKIVPIPVLIFGREYWDRIIDFEALAAEGAVAPEDVRLFRFVETAEEAWEIIERAWNGR